MIIAAFITLYAGTALLAGSALCTGRYLQTAEQRVLGWAHRLLIAGALCLVLAFGARWIEWGLVPLTTLTDSLLLFALLSALIMAFIARGPVKALLCFYVPPLALIAVINAVVAHHYFLAAPKVLRGMLLSAHVGLAFLAYAFFFVASATSVAYLFQVHSLKHRRTAGLFRKLPPLERLDRTLFLLIRYGYVFFGITLILGGIWSRIDADLLGAHWWLSAKIIRAIVMFMFYAAAYHMRQLGWLRGQRLAYFVFLGFSLLMASYVVLGVAGLSNYNFWGSAS
jgi:ABC-type transport system involved in cytochrome c biogenesis permease subunit